MNNILELKAQFKQKDNGGGGSRNLPPKVSVETSHLRKLQSDLRKVQEFWQNDNFLNGAIVSVFYDRVIAKSNRLQALLKETGKEPNDSIVGAKFVYDKETNDTKHVITHYLPRNIFAQSIDLLEKTIECLDEIFSGIADAKKIDALRQNKEIVFAKALSKNLFINIIVDSFYVEKFDVIIDSKNILKETQSIITLYKTGITAKELMYKVGVTDLFTFGADEESTVLLDPAQYNKLVSVAPYLVAMSLNDLRNITFNNSEKNQLPSLEIPSPKDEPIIGVIDTVFDESAYFSEWVEYKESLPDGIEPSPNDRDHGTMVSSIIVDGPKLNPELDDECGRFRVRHFGLVAGKFFSSFHITREIKKIVIENPEIKVWNICLGSPEEIDENFISPEAAVLDELQFKYDVIFVIAGTNKDKKNQIKIGAPADSINGIVVNAVDKDGKPASYSREGPVLSFYNKPDVSYYGGERGDGIAVYSYDKVFKTGTSFAAPWISRKLSYLIQVIGLPREVAKALLIDSATGWSERQYSKKLVGYGVVPKKISDILKTPDDEIRFVMTGKKEKFDTYLYNIPVPTAKNQHPFVARATLCYFPCCDRNQGVDYTLSELNIQFGRIKDDGKILTINDDKQDDTNERTTEKEAREKYRKWDNVKHIIEFFTKRKQPKMAYKTQMWGLSVKSKERLTEKHALGMTFGLVVTLKEITGKNRIDTFIQDCMVKGIMVKQIDIKNQIDIYNKIHEEIELE